MTLHAHDHDAWTHGHVFLGQGHRHAERRTRIVTLFTAAFMAVEIAGGLAFHSMALLADGIHMATHVGALGLAAGAYYLARRHALDTRFTFGSGKFGDLAAFASAIILGLLAIGVGVESIGRLLVPGPVAYREALPIAALGLGVNIVSALILQTPHDHGHGHGHDHAHHHDHNMRAAYVHVLADAATSVLAIAALVISMYSHSTFADPLVGIVGSVVIASWAFGLIRASGAVLLDASVDKDLEGVIRDRLETKGDRVTDLHLWQLGPGHRAAFISMISDSPLPPATYKRRLKGLRDLCHITVEVELCPHHGQAAE